MKTSLTLLAIVTAIAAPAAFASELAGYRLPTVMQADHLFAAFVATVLLLTFLRDYARPAGASSRTGLALRRLKSAHPLAA